MVAHFKQDVEQVCSDECVSCDSIGEQGCGRHSSEKPRGHTRRAFVAGGICLAAVAAAGAATPAMAADLVDGLKAKAGDVSDLLNETLAALKGLDFVSANELAARTSAAVSDLRSQMQGPLWGAAEWVPVLGEDVKAARALVDVLAGLVDGALVPVSQALSAVELDRLVVAEGSDRVRFDVAAIQAVADAVRQAAPVLDEAACTRCLLCYMQCPDGTIYKVADENARGGIRLAVDYDFCKGCGVCAKACRCGAISMVPEHEEAR